MTEHTPGPWRIDTGLLMAGDIVIGQIVCRGSRFRFSEKGDKEEQANARVIYTAPETVAERDRLKAINAELLEASKWAYRAFCDPPPVGITHAELITKLQKAIAKATDDDA